MLPAASAGAKPQPAIGIGKFHGTITPTTPSGSWKVTSRPPATGICRPISRSGAPRVVGQDVADVAGLPAGVADGVPGVAHLQLGQLLEVRVDQRRRTGAAAAPGRRARPAATASKARRARAIAASVVRDVREAATVGDDLLGRRVDDVVGMLVTLAHSRSNPRTAPSR